MATPCRADTLSPQPRFPGIVEDIDDDFCDIQRLAAALEEMTTDQPQLSDDEANDDERVLKVVVCGDGASGKTSLSQRFAKEAFGKNYHQTIGLDFFNRRITLPGEPPIQVLMQVWDIGGQSFSSEMVEKYLIGAHCAMLCYDVTNQKSFDNLHDWLGVVRRVTANQPKAPYIMLVGNKVDMEVKRVVNVEAHNNFAKNNDINAVYTSAKTGDSVLLAFRMAAAGYLKIPLTKTDQEADVTVIEGEVSHEAPLPKRGRGAHQTHTAVCSLQ